MVLSRLWDPCRGGSRVTSPCLGVGSGAVSGSPAEAGAGASSPLRTAASCVGSGAPEGASPDARPGSRAGGGGPCPWCWLQLWSSFCRGPCGWRWTVPRLWSCPGSGTSTRLPGRSRSGFLSQHSSLRRRWSRRRTKGHPEPAFACTVPDTEPSWSLPDKPRPGTPSGRLPGCIHQCVG